MEDWYHVIAIGILQYLGNNTRPDSCYANSSCMRYSNDPREPHGNAVPCSRSVEMREAMGYQSPFRVITFYMHHNSIKEAKKMVLLRWHEREWRILGRHARKAKVLPHPSATEKRCYRQNREPS